MYPKCVNDCSKINRTATDTKQSSLSVFMKMIEQAKQLHRGSAIQYKDLKIGIIRYK